MQHDDWDRVQSLFLAAADLSPGERERFLQSACGGDRDLQAEVESLLASDHKSGERISSAVESEAALLFDAQALVGDRLGAYRVVKEIGRGGMGSVYLAIRDDDQYRKQVAIKVVKRGMDTVEVLERFRHERQILANLDHPYIARLLDAGTTLDGRPFFVMDYVEGQPLDIFCREHKLDVRARCQLFLRILEAVAHAHRNLVVHRDLKPGNIFVTAAGAPKLLDFGVAKLLNADGIGGLTATITGRPFTPEYASPEQVRGQAVTTVADIYSLGAIFYELLTGQRAQPMAAFTPVEVERVICETEIRRPSLVARGLDSDLDNIVSMAMRKEPARRYQSVDQLAEDIGRYLNGRPVLARQDSFSYRSGKFVRRNKFKIAAVAVVFASLVAGLAISISQSRQAEAARRGAEAQRTIAERERSRAEAESRNAEAARASESQQRRNADQQRDVALLERARAEQRLTQMIALADKTLFDLHDAIASLPGAIQARRLIVKTTLDYLERLEKDHGLDDRMRLVLSTAYGKVADIQGDAQGPSLGDFDGASASYRKAQALLAPLYDRKRDDPEVVLRWLTVEMNLAELTTSFQRKEGVEAWARILPVAHKLALLKPSDKQSVRPEAVVSARLAHALQTTDALKALEHANRQIAIMTELVSRFPDDADLKMELGSGLAAAAEALKGSGNLTAAAEYYERSIRIREPLLERLPQNVGVQRSLLVVYGNYASLLGMPWSANLGRFAEARAYCEKSVALARKLADADSQDMTARYDLAISLSRLGMVEPDPQSAAESLKSLQEALSILDPMMKANPKPSSRTIQVALARQYAGRRLRSLGQTAAAAEYFRAALTELEALMKSDPSQGVAQMIDNEEQLAELYAAEGDRGLALDFANRAVARAEEYARVLATSDAAKGFRARAYLVLASVRRKLGDWDLAGEAAERGVSLMRPIRSPAVIAIHKQVVDQAEALIREVAAHRAQ